MESRKQFCEKCKKKEDDYFLVTLFLMLGNAHWAEGLLKRDGDGGRFHSHKLLAESVGILQVIGEFRLGEVIPANFFIFVGEFEKLFHRQVDLAVRFAECGIEEGETFGFEREADVG